MNTIARLIIIFGYAVVILAVFQITKDFWRWCMNKENNEKARF